MSYSDDPVKDADRWQSRIDADNERIDRHQAEQHRLLVAAIGTGDVQTPCDFAHVGDKEDVRLHDVLEFWLNCGDGPKMADVLQILLDASRSTDADLAVKASELVDRIAAKWTSLQTPYGDGD